MGRRKKEYSGMPAPRKEKRHRKSKHRRDGKVKKKTRKSKKSRAELALPADTLIGGALRAPVNYPETGMSNDILAPSNIGKESVKTWVHNKFFAPVNVPNDCIANIEEQQFLPVAFG